MTNRPEPGILHPVDEALYRHTVLQRNAAWREVESLLVELRRLREERQQLLDRLEAVLERRAGYPGTGGTPLPQEHEHGTRREG